MKLDWIIEPADIAKVKAFVDEHRENAFVQSRVKRNLRSKKPSVSREEFWEVLVGCLLTTQQRSGPNSPVSRFMGKQPFPLSLGTCCGQSEMEKFVGKTLRSFGGLRRFSVIGRELAANLNFLCNGGWDATLEQLEKVRLNSTPKTEREAADFVADHFKGIGPKQSRNLLQWLGLSRYETPIDSRITRWLNEFGFPLQLSAKALADRNYYNLVAEGFQKLAGACGVMPCILDAAIFASYDGDGWTTENVVG